MRHWTEEVNFLFDISAVLHSRDIATLKKEMTNPMRFCKSFTYQATIYGDMPFQTISRQADHGKDRCQLIMVSESTAGALDVNLVMY